MRYPEEPHVIVGGRLIHVGAISMLERLQASRHLVALVDGALCVEPDDLDEDVRYLLEAFEEDLTLLLAAGGLRVH